MPHELPLLINIAVALSYALVGGLIARRVGLPPIVGYLLAGVAIGPFTPGFVGDPDSIGQLAELGVIFLMFGVGLHFSFKDLWQVRDIAIPGAVIQMIAGHARSAIGSRALWGWSPAAALVLGVAISVASTVVLLRGLMDTRPARHAARTSRGRLAGARGPAHRRSSSCSCRCSPERVGGVGVRTAAMAIGKAPLFVALMLVVGTRVVPWLLQRVVRTRSRELFVLVALDRRRSARRSRSAAAVSACRSRSARSSPASSSASRPSATRSAPTCCRSARRSRCCSSSRSACWSNPAYLAAHWVAGAGADRR